MDNSSNVCGLEFNYKNGEKEGDSNLKEEKEDKKLEEGEETKQYKMEGLGENEDNKSLLADKADDKAFYNASSSLALEWNQKQTSKQTNNCRGGRGENEGGEEVFDSLLLTLVMIMKGLQRAMEGTMGSRILTGNTILMRCVIKSTQELRMFFMSHVTLMSHVTCPMSL